ncbi:unnamed protein product [Phaeothamnion confervicola]
MDILRLLDPPTRAKYRRFRFAKENPTARNCPRCEHPQLGGTAVESAMRCQKCSHSYCFVHGDAHVSGTCADYERANREGEGTRRVRVGLTEEEQGRILPCHFFPERNRKDQSTSLQNSSERILSACCSFAFCAGVGNVHTRHVKVAMFSR